MPRAEGVCRARAPVHTLDAPAARTLDVGGGCVGVCVGAGREGRPTARCAMCGGTTNVQHQCVPIGTDPLHCHCHCQWHKHWTRATLMCGGTIHTQGGMNE